MHECMNIYGWYRFKQNFIYGIILRWWIQNSKTISIFHNQFRMHSSGKEIKKQNKIYYQFQKVYFISNELTCQEKNYFVMLCDMPKTILHLRVGHICFLVQP